jgi:hypothetical protein
MTTPGESPSGLPRIMTPARGAELLRDAGLEEITECALRTRAYRKQIPFHRNGHRIFFTMEDLCEIARGTACHPVTSHRTEVEHLVPAPRPLVMKRRRAPHADDNERERWRARRLRDG